MVGVKFRSIEYILSLTGDIFWYILMIYSDIFWWSAEYSQLLLPRLHQRDLCQSWQCEFLPDFNWLHNLYYLPVHQILSLSIGNCVLYFEFSEFVIGKCRIGIHNLSMTQRCLSGSPICHCHPPRRNIGNYHAIGWVWVSSVIARSEICSNICRSKMPTLDKWTFWPKKNITHFQIWKIMISSLGKLYF